MIQHKTANSNFLALGAALLSFHLTAAQAQAQGSGATKSGTTATESQNAGKRPGEAGTSAGGDNGNRNGSAAATNATRPQNVGGGKPAASQTEATIEKANDKSERKIQAEKGEGTPFAQATLEARSGSTVAGTVQFNKVKGGLKVSVTMAGGKPGRHGIHIHETGDCSAKDATSAGGHFNPLGGKHAGPDHQGRHVGDLGNITVQQDGKGLLSIDIPDIKGFDWAQIVGKSVVIHEKGDDLVTQPSGDSGARIACGAITASSKTAP